MYSKQNSAGIGKPLRHPRIRSHLIYMLEDDTKCIFDFINLNYRLLFPCKLAEESKEAQQPLKAQFYKIHIFFLFETFLENSF